MAIVVPKQSAAQIEILKRDEWLSAFKRALNTRSTGWVSAIGTQKNIIGVGVAVRLQDIIFDEKTAVKSSNKEIADLSVIIGKTIYDPTPGGNYPMLVVGVQMAAPYNLLLYSGPTSNTVKFFNGVSKFKTNNTLVRCTKTFITPFFKNLAIDKGLKYRSEVNGFSTSLNDKDTIRLDVMFDFRARIVCKHPDTFIENHYHYDAAGVNNNIIVISDLGSLASLYLDTQGFDRTKIFDLDYLLEYSLSPGEGYQLMSRSLLQTKAQTILTQVKNTGKVELSLRGRPKHTELSEFGLPLLFLNKDPEVKALFEEIYEVLACVGIEKTIEYTKDLTLIIFNTKQIIELLRKINSDYWRRFMPSFGIPYFFEYKGQPLYTQTHLLLALTILKDITSITGSGVVAGLPQNVTDEINMKPSVGIYKGNYLMPYKNKEELSQYEKYYSGGLLQLKNILQSDLDMAGKMELLEVIAALGSF